MLYVVDKSVINEVHVVFNSAMLKVIRTAFPKEKIVFMADANHTKLVMARLEDADKENILAEPLVITLSFSSGIKKIFEWLAKMFNDVLFFRMLLKRISKKDDVLYLLNVPAMSFVLFKALKLFYPKKRVFITLHGELEYMYYYNDSREKGIGLFYKCMFALGGKNITYILLNKIAKRHLVNDGFIKPEDAIEINHPYIFKNIETKTNLNPTLICANVGSLMKRKNGQLIFNLALELKKYIESNYVELKTIGSVDGEMLKYKNDLVKGVPNNISILHHIERADFESQVQQIDFALFFFDQTQFVFRASGVILDVVNYTKPIIAIKHPLLESLFNECGDFGFLCSNIEEMASLISNIANDKEKYKHQYSNFINNLLQLKDKMSLESVTLDFKKQINSLKGN